MHTRDHASIEIGLRWEPHVADRYPTVVPFFKTFAPRNMYTKLAAGLGLDEVVYYDGTGSDVSASLDASFTLGWLPLVNDDCAVGMEIRANTILLLGEPELLVGLHAVVQLHGPDE